LNRACFDIKNDRSLEIALAVGISHELRHESGVAGSKVGEFLLNREDVQMTKALAAQDQVNIPEYLQDLALVIEGGGLYSSSLSVLT